MNNKEYENYVYLQTVKYMSHEDEQTVWASGQIRFLDSILHLISPNSKILDVGCGDGISLQKLSNLGHDVVGIDLNDAKLTRAIEKGFSVVNADMHEMFFAEDDSFDVIISSHSLEHAYDPILALKEFNRVLKKDGLLFIVLPFPDNSEYSAEAHVGRDILGTSDPVDGPRKLTKIMNDNYFTINLIKYDDYREPEIWLYCRKV